MKIEWLITLDNKQKWTHGFQMVGDLKTKIQWKTIGTFIGKDISDSMVEVTCKKIKKEKV